MPAKRCNFCGSVGCKKRHSYRDKSGYVLARMNRGNIVGVFAYFDGHDDWTTHDNARIYYTARAARAARREALAVRDEKVAEDVALVSVWV